MSTPIVAIDPGHDGAAVLLGADGLPLQVWSWRRRRRVAGNVYALAWERRGAAVARLEVAHLVSVSRLIAEVVHGRVAEVERAHLVVEGLFVHHSASKQTAIELGRTVGWLTSHLVEQAASYDDGVIAGEWRPAVLGCRSSASSDEAERLALLRWGRRWTGELASDPHVAEADAIGWHRRSVLRMQAAQPTLVESKKRRRA